MDLNLDESKHDNEKVEPGELLEDCWFFGNLLLQRKPRMLRSYSDPCSSSNFHGKSYEETPERHDQTPPQRRTSSNSLVRAPSLPTSLETHDFQDEEIEFSMGKLIRQASLNYSDTLPPRKHAIKVLAPNSSISRQKSRRKPEGEVIKRSTQKSLKDLESEELQGFKDLGFDFDKKDFLSPNVISIIPGLQEKKRIQEDEEKRIARPYLSEAWAARSSTLPVPRWGGKRSTEDMKAQIKFWAREVASNVRQEC